MAVNRQLAMGRLNPAELAFRRWTMSKRISILIFLAVTWLIFGCHSAPPKMSASAVVFTVRQSVTNANAWSYKAVPTDLTVFGRPTKNSIRVAIFGVDRGMIRRPGDHYFGRVVGNVKRPGYYHLARGAVVRDAVEVAQGLSEFVQWTESGIQRQRSDGTVEFIRLTRDVMVNEQIFLNDGYSLVFILPQPDW